MPTAALTPYRIRPGTRPVLRGFDFKHFTEGLCKLYNGLPEAADGDRHQGAYVRLVLEVANKKPKPDADPKEAVPAKEFASYFMERNPAYSTTKAGISALLFESWLATQGGELFGIFLETVLLSKSDYLAIFTGPISENDFNRIQDKVTEFATVEVAVHAGDRDYKRGIISDVTMLACKASKGAIDPAKTDPDQVEIGGARTIESLLPQTHAEYRKVLDEGGLSSSAVPIVFGRDPFGAARFESGRLAIDDPNGVVWLSEDDGKQWVPDVTTVRDQHRETKRPARVPTGRRDESSERLRPLKTALVETLFEKHESGALRSNYGSWAVFQALVAAGSQATVVAVRERVWTVDESVANIQQALAKIAETYAGMGPEFDVMAEAFLAEFADDRGVAVANRSDLASVLESSGDMIEDRDSLVDANCIARLMAESGTLAEFKRAPRPKDPDAYRAQVGMCPDGYHYDAASKRCVKNGQAPAAPARTAAPAAPAPAPSKAAPAAAPAAGAPAAKPAAAAPSHGGSNTAEKIKTLTHHAVGMVMEPFHAGLALIRKPEARKALRTKLVTAAKKEGKETAALAVTVGKALSGQKVTREERNAAISQTADLVKMAVIGTIYGHMLAGGVMQALATLASPADEMVGIALDKPLRKITKKLFGVSHGLLPTAFYEGTENADAVLGRLFDAILDELSKVKVSEEDMADAISQARHKQPTDEAFPPPKQPPPPKSGSSPPDTDDTSKPVGTAGKDDEQDPSAPPLQPPPPPEPEVTNDHMDDPPFYRDDLQGYYDLQITAGLTPAEAQTRVRQRFKVKGLEVTPSGEVRAPGIIDRPKSGGPPPPPPPAVSNPAPPPIPPEIATGGPLTAPAPQEAPPAAAAPPEAAPAAPAPSEATQARAGRHGSKSRSVSESAPVDQQLQLPTVDDAFMYWLTYEDGDLDEFGGWLDHYCPHLSTALEVWQPSDAPLVEGRVQALAETHARRTKSAVRTRTKRQLTTEEVERYEKWRRLVNMPAKSVRRFLASESFREAAQDTRLQPSDVRLALESARRTLLMKSTPVEEWSGDLWNWCGRQTHFISRLRGSPAPLIEQGRITRKYLTLKAWGHDPGVVGRISEADVIVRQRSTTTNVWTCPHCREEIGEKALFHGRKDEAGEFQNVPIADNGGSWFHRACRGQIELPRPTTEAVKATNRLIDSLSGSGPRLIVVEGVQAPDFDVLRRNRTMLSEAERAFVLEKHAVWNNGARSEKTPAVWKSDVDGTTWFVTNTHRAFQTHSTLEGAVHAYHRVIKQTI